ncbi:uncharacterized protein LOC132721198 isoform X2 [Ruditapes philippinarum]|nr:uncharacterized protein LOC132721198 isoform X2 [Ruditapes philippinarum]
MGYAHKHKKFITLMRSRIIRDVEPRKFMHMLVTNKTLSLKDHEDIMRLMHRKDQVKELLAIANEGNSRSAKVIHAIIEASPKLYKEYKLKAQRGSCQSLSSSVGAAIEIKMNVRSKNMSDTNQQFTMIEKQVVDTYNSVEQENHDDMLNDMVEECRCKFEGLKISSIVIQLLTLDDDSKEKILSKVRNGKLVEWFISMLDENNLNALRQFGNVQLEIIISEDIGGNFNSLISLKDCLCKVDRKFVVENKKRLKEIIADETFLNQLLEQIGLTTSNSTLQNEKGITDKKLSIRVLDLLEDGTAPRIAYCLIEEHIKLKVPSAVGLLTKSGNGNTQTVPSKSDIDLHIEYLTEELEIQSFTPILSTLKTKSSMMLLDELEKCPCRRTRIVKFLEFLKLQEDITWFWTEVKKKQHYIFDTIASSTSHSKLKEDLLAVKLMNDTIIEEVDPTLLWQYMDEKSAEKLGKIEFRNITSRKRQTQYMLNRLSLANIYEFMKTLRRCGYENLYSEIDAGSLSERYVCPRLHELHGKGKRIFKGQFDIDTRCKEMVDTSRSLSERYVCPRLHELHGKGKRIFKGQFDIDTRCKEMVDTSRSLSERYVCPRLHERHGKGKRIFKGQFDIDTKCKEMVDTSKGIACQPCRYPSFIRSSLISSHAIGKKFLFIELIH